MSWRPPAPPMLWLIRSLLATALVLSVVLVIEAARGGELPGCGPGAGCDAALHSPWARLNLGIGGLSLPVALPGALLYGLLLTGTFVLRRRVGWMLLLAGAAAALAAGAWFGFVQWRILGQMCAYCTTAHLCAAAAGALIWLHAPLGRGVEDAAMRIQPRAAMALAGGGAACVVALVMVQSLHPAPGTRVSLLQGAVSFDARLMPHLGESDAPVVLAEVFDYTCPYCRELDSYLRQARQRYGPQLAIVLLVAPLNRDCNPHVPRTEPPHQNACALAKLALAVWIADSAKFQAMHHWLFDHADLLTFDSPYGSNVKAAHDFAEQLVGKDALDQALADPTIDAWIQANNDLLDALGGNEPMLLLGNLRINGRPNSAAELFNLLEHHTSLWPEPEKE